jgi:hypothetical protein
MISLFAHQFLCKKKIQYTMTSILIKKILIKQESTGWKKKQYTSDHSERAEE